MKNVGTTLIKIGSDLKIFFGNIRIIWETLKIFEKILEIIFMILFLGQFDLHISINAINVKWKSDSEHLIKGTLSAP